MAKRILVVDDDPNIRRIVTLTLEEDDAYQVTSVSSAEAALLQITRQSYDLLFTDINMPGMSGIDLVQRVRDLDLKTAVIVFSVNPDELTADRAEALQVDCLLEKPVAPDQIRLAVDILLNPMRLLPHRRDGSAVEPPDPRPAPRSAAPLKRIQTRPLPAPAPVAPTPPPPAPPPPTPPPPVQSQPAPLPAKAPEPPVPAPVAMRMTGSGRNYSDDQLEGMRRALKELALEPNVHCAVLTNISGIVLTHWSRRRDINVTVVAALAAGNSMAMAEMSRNLGQAKPGNLIIQEGPDQSIIMAQTGDMLLVIAVGAKASLGWARIATLRACEEVARIAAHSN